jgi:beta-galactosidase
MLAPERELPANVHERSGVNGYGRALRYYFNYSGAAVNFHYRHQAGVNLLSSRRVQPDQAMTLGPWELAIVEEDGQAGRPASAK